LIVDAIAHIAPGTLRARKLRKARTSIPSWIAPDAELRDRIVERALNADPRLAGGARGRPPRRRYARFYFDELRRSLDHPLVVLELEETFEQGRRVGAAIRAPYWDADVLELLYRTPPELLNRGGRAKGLVRESLARRFPNLGFERQRKVTSVRFATSLLFSETAEAWRAVGRPRALAEAGVVDPKSVELAVERVATAETNPRSAQTIWDILNLEVWLRSRV
jgi:asparagine synthetase B (glutamine-hydrolysing)